MPRRPLPDPNRSNMPNNIPHQTCNNWFSGSPANGGIYLKDEFKDEMIYIYVALDTIDSLITIK